MPAENELSARIMFLLRERWYGSESPAVDALRTFPNLSMKVAASEALPKPFLEKTSDPLTARLLLLDETDEPAVILAIEDRGVIVSLSVSPYRLSALRLPPERKSDFMSEAAARIAAARGDAGTQPESTPSASRLWSQAAAACLHEEISAALPEALSVGFQGNATVKELHLGVSRAVWLALTDDRRRSSLAGAARASEKLLGLGGHPPGPLSLYVTGMVTTVVSGNVISNRLLPLGPGKSLATVDVQIRSWN